MSIEDLYQLYLQHPIVITDTRKIKGGEIYFALKGVNFNGNTFAQPALAAGAVYAVIDEPQYKLDDKTIVVPNVLQTLQALARHHRQQFAIPFLAITGSNGKTTTKELIHAVLSTKYKTYTTEGNLNNHIGVPLTLLKMRPDAELAIIEMGANHQKEIEGYCQCALPTHGLITNCGKAHLEGFGGEEGVRKGKGELFDFLRNHQGTAFVITDYGYLLPMANGINEVVGYGTKQGMVTGQVLQSDPFLAVSFTKGIRGNVNTQLVGDYNLPNVLAAAAVGVYFGVAEQKIKNAMEGYSPTNSRSQMIEKDSNKIIMDAYNANPSSMKAAIANFAAMEAKRKVLLLGAMAEMGEASEVEHQALVDEVAKNKWDDVLLVGPDFKKAVHNYDTFANAAEAGKALQQKNIQHAVILIKGSRSTGMEKLLEFI